MYLNYRELLSKSLELNYDTSYVSKFIKLHPLITTSNLYTYNYIVCCNFIDYSFKLSQKDLSKLFIVEVYSTAITA
jgi:hypothetical protein